MEAVYDQVDHTSDDATVTYLKDGCEIHWIVNPNQDGVYQQKLDEALKSKNYGMAGALSVYLFIVSAILCFFVYRMSNDTDPTGEKAAKKLEKKLNKGGKA